MQATPIAIDIEGGFSKVTLYVADLAPFKANFGKQIDLAVTEVEQPKMPEPAAENTTAAPTAPPENVVELPPINAGGSKEETVTNVPGTTPPPDACDICKGSGAVSQFPDTTTPGSGNPVRCETCKGTGIKPPAPLNT